jgi:hypothetical protein
LIIKRNRVGRPAKQLEDAQKEAALVLEIALMLKQGRLSAIKQAGFSEASAIKYVMQRRRGLAADLIGSSVNELLGGTTNRTSASLRLVTTHGFSLALAARIFKLDRRNLQKKLKEARDAAEADAIRQADFLSKTTVTDAARSSKGCDPL